LYRTVNVNTARARADSSRADGSRAGVASSVKETGFKNRSLHLEHGLS